MTSDITLAQALPEYSFEKAIRTIINPDSRVSRYGRTWRFSLPKMHDGFLVGKLGFTSEGKEKKADYDEIKKDFIEHTIDSKQSTFVFWVLLLSEQILAFETKPPDIKYQSFKGAFEGFLEEYPDTNFVIETVVETSQFVDWVREVDRVTRFTANLRAPNPDYSKHPDFIYRVLGETNADKARIDLCKTSDSTDSLNTENTITAMVEYGKDGYSSIIARGVKNEKLKIFDSRKRIPVEQVTLPSDSINDDKKWDLIIKTLRNFLE